MAFPCGGSCSTLCATVIVHDQRRVHGDVAAHVEQRAALGQQQQRKQRPGCRGERGVGLSNGEYEVHYIGVNWPHHIFVSQSFRVLGAD
jgi:hypothetical protein